MTKQKLICFKSLKYNSIVFVFYGSVSPAFFSVASFKVTRARPRPRSRLRATAADRHAGRQGAGASVGPDRTPVRTPPGTGRVQVPPPTDVSGARRWRGSSQTEDRRRPVED